MDFWFAPSSALWLGMQRALYCAVVFCNVLPERRSRFLELDRVFRQPSFPLTHLPLPTPRLGLVLELIWKFSLLCSCLGLATNFSLGVAAVLGLYWFSLPNQFGSQHHRNHVTVQILLILACSHCGDAFSLDSLVWGREVPASGLYTWPARMICLSLTGMFCAAGWTKLRWSGLAWVKGLSFYLVRGLCLPYDARPLSPFNLQLARQRRLCQLGAAAVLALECLSPLGLLALLGHKIFYLFPLGILASLAAIRFLLGPAFVNVAAAHLFWLTPPGPWDGAPPDGSMLPLLLLLLGGTACAWLFQREIFPFSNYPMYAARCGPQLDRLLLYGVDCQGEEIELWDQNQARLLPLDRWTVHLHLLRLADPESRERALRECLRLARQNGLVLSRLRLYQARWEFKEDQPQLPLPRRGLLHELVAEPG